MITKEKEEKIKLIGFTQGVVYACARLIEMFDQPNMALNILDKAGLPDLTVASEYDLLFLRKERPSIPYGHDAYDEFVCEFCGEKFRYEADFLAHQFNSPCDPTRGENHPSSLTE